MATPDPHDRLLSVTQLADELGTTARAIRFYESKGLLDPQRAGGNRVYTYRDRARLLLILRGKRLGFSLAEVKQYLDLYDVDHTQQAQMQQLLRGARQRIAELEEQRHDLEVTIDELREIERQTLAAMEEAGIEDLAPARGRRRPAGRRVAAAVGAGNGADELTGT
jgi:DNA-binding transcriptional MerR regulator